MTDLDAIKARLAAATPGEWASTWDEAPTDIQALITELEAARAWIASEGARCNVCTFAVLGEVCVGCRCERA